MKESEYVLKCSCALSVKQGRVAASFGVVASFRLV